MVVADRFRDRIVRLPDKNNEILEIQAIAKDQAKEGSVKIVVENGVTQVKAENANFAVKYHVKSTGETCWRFKGMVPREDVFLW